MNSIHQACIDWFDQTYGWQYRYQKASCEIGHCHDASGRNYMYRYSQEYKDLNHDVLVYMFLYRGKELMSVHVSSVHTEGEVLSNEVIDSKDLDLDCFKPAVEKVMCFPFGNLVRFRLEEEVDALKKSIGDPIEEFDKLYTLPEDMTEDERIAIREAGIRYHADLTKIYQKHVSGLCPVDMLKDDGSLDQWDDARLTALVKDKKTSDDQIVQRVAIGDYQEIARLAKVSGRLDDLIDRIKNRIMDQIDKRESSPYFGREDARRFAEHNYDEWVSRFPLSVAAGATPHLDCWKKINSN